VLIEVDPDDGRPIYRQIADEVRRGIATGVLQRDEPLPAVRRLAVDLGLNPNTVQQAYRQLERDGLVYVRRGRGTFVAPAPKPSTGRSTARQVAERALRDAFRRGVSPPELAAAIRELIGRRR
jgi:GntR family transcriptional regulator